MSLLEHLEELRQRLTRCILAAAVGFAVCFAYAEEILMVLLRPLKQVLPQNSTIQTTALTEGFFVSMKAAFVAGLFLVSPVIFHQIWKFIAPGLYAHERRMAIPVAIFTALCFVSGACFGYFVVFPFGFTFLANYASDIVTLNPKLSEYYSLALGLLLAFGIIFEMPVFIFFLAAMGVVDHTWLRQKRRWAIVIFFIVAAVLTPTPDAVNQILMAAPMVVLYEVSIWVAYFFGKKKSATDDGNLPAPTDGGEGVTDAAPPAPATDAALEEARASETPRDEASATGSTALGKGASAARSESSPGLDGGGDPGASRQSDSSTAAMTGDDSDTPARPDAASSGNGGDDSDASGQKAAPAADSSRNAEAFVGQAAPGAAPQETGEDSPFGPVPDLKGFYPTPEEAERAAHDVAALGHDLDGPAPGEAARNGADEPTSGDAALAGADEPTPGEAVRNQTDAPVPGEAVRTGKDDAPLGESAIPAADAPRGEAAHAPSEAPLRGEAADSHAANAQSAPSHPGEGSRLDDKPAPGGSGR